MKENVLNEFKCHIDIDAEGPIKPATVMNERILADELYSYIVYAEYKDNVLSGWTIKFMVSSMAKYNTISKAEAVLNVCDIINNSYSTEQTKYVIGYKQPPLDMLIEIFDPLVHKLAEQQHRQWGLEVEDLCQMCRLSICVLYNKGYYIHKSLVNKAFVNQVLMQLRKDKYKPQVVSLDEFMKIEDDDKGISLLDIVPDEKAEQELYAREEKENAEHILQQQRELIVSIVGQRQYDQLLREYGNKMTSATGRKSVATLKSKLRDMGITIRSFY